MTMITPSYLGETIEYSSLHACRSTLEDPTAVPAADANSSFIRIVLAKNADNTPATLSVLGNALTADQFVFEKTGSSVEVSGTNLGFLLQDGDQRIVQVSNASFAFRFTEFGIAGAVLNATVVGPDLPGLQINGTVSLMFNTTSAAQTLELGTQSVTLAPAAVGGTYFHVIVTNGTLSILGTTLSANEFDFQSANAIITLNVSNLTLKLGDGSPDLADVTVASASLNITSQGISTPTPIAASVNVNVPGVSFTGSFTVSIDTTPAVDALTISSTNGVTLNVPGALSLGGSFVLQQVTVAGRKVVTVGVSGLTLTLGGANAFVSVINGSGVLLLNSLGLAGSFSVMIQPLAIPGVTMSATTIALSLNTGNAAVTDAVPLPGGTLTLNLPAGPFVQVTAIGALITVGSFSLNGDFTFEQDSLGNTLIAVANASLTQDGNGITGGQGAFVVIPAGAGNSGGFAGFLSGVVQVSAGAGFSAGGTVEVRVNTTNKPVNQAINLGGQSISIVFAANETAAVSPPAFVQVSVGSASLQIGQFVTLEGNFSFTNNMLGATDVTIFLGRGPPQLADGSANPNAQGVLVTNASIGLVQTPGGGSFTLSFQKSSSDTIQTTPPIPYNSPPSFVQSALAALSNIGANNVMVTQPSPGEPYTVTFQNALANMSLTGLTINGSQLAVAGAINATTTMPGDSGHNAVQQANVMAGGGTFTLSFHQNPADPAQTTASLAFNASAQIVQNALTGLSNIGANNVSVTGSAGGPYTVTFQGALAHMSLPTLGVDGRLLLPVASVTTTMAGSSTQSLIQSVAVLDNGAPGYALQASGTVSVLGIPGVTLSGTATIQFNSTGQAFNNQSIPVGGGNPAVVLNFPTAVNVAQVTVTGGVLNVLGQSLTGNFSFGQSTDAGGAKVMTVAVSSAGLVLAGGLVSVQQAQGLFVVTSAGIAGTLQGNLQASDAPDVQFGAGFTVALNTAASAVNEQFSFNSASTTINLPAGPYFRIEGTNAQLTILQSVTLTGNFAVEQSGSQVSIAATNVSLGLGNGAQNLVSITGGSGFFVITSSGLAGTLSGTLTANVPGVSFGGSFQVAINTTGAAVNTQFNVDSSRISLNLPAGKFVQVVGTGVTLTVLGQTLTGDFTFQQQTTIGGTQLVTVSFANVALSLGDGSASFVNVTGGAGVFFLTAAGLAGQSTVNVAVDPGTGVAFTGSFTLQINSTTQAVNDSVLINGTTIPINLPAGPFLQIAGTGLTLSVGGQTIAGNFTFQTQTVGGSQVVTVGVSGATLSLGNGTSSLLTVANGTGALILTSQGLAGSFSGSLSVNITGVTLTANTISVEVNTGASAVNQAVMVGGQAVAVNVPGGPCVQIAVVGAQLAVAGQSLSGDFVFDQGQASDNTLVTRAAVTNLSVTVNGQGLQGGTGAIVVTSAGIAGVVSGQVSVAAGGLQLGGSVAVRFNTTGAVVNETMNVNGVSVTIAFTSAEGNLFQFVIANGSINIGNFVTITGAGSFKTNGNNKIYSGTNLNVFLGQGPYKLADGSLNPGARGLVVTGATFGLVDVPGSGGAADTYALQASGAVQVVGIPNLTLSGTITVDFNNTGMTFTSPVNFATTANVISFSGTGMTLTVLNQNLTGGFSFSQATASDGQNVLIVAFNGVGLNLGPNNAVIVSGVNGSILLTPQGLAGQVSGSVMVTQGGTLSGSASINLLFNTTGAPVQKTVTIGANTISINVPAGPYLQVEVPAMDLTVTVSGQSQILSGYFLFEQTPTLLRVAVKNITLKLGAGTNGIVEVTGGQGNFELTSNGLAGTLSGTVAVNVSGLAVKGAFQVQVNTGSSPVNDSFAVDGLTVSINLPAGPYLQVTGTGVVLQLTVSSVVQTLSGNFTLTKTAAGVQLAISNGTFSLGNGSATLVQVTQTAGQTATLTITSAGIVGNNLSGSVTLLVPGVTLTGTLTANIDTTAGTPIVQITGAATLAVAGQQLSGVFTFQETSATDTTKLIEVAFAQNGANSLLKLQNGAATYVNVTAGSGEFVITPQGIAASFSVTAAVTLPGLNITGGTFTIQFNTIPATVDETVPVGSGTSEIKVGAGTFARVEVDNATLQFGNTGQQSGFQLGGTGSSFLFDRSTQPDGTALTRVALLGLTVTAGGNTYVQNGQGAFIVTGNGVAGFLSGQAGAGAGGFSVNASIGLRFNTTGEPIDQTITLNGQTLAVQFPTKDDVFSFFGSASINIGNFVTIEGSFNITNNQLGVANANVFLGQGPATLSDGSINPSARGILLRDASLGLVNPAAGQYALYASGAVELLGVAGVSFSGTATIQFNNTGAAFNGREIQIPNAPSVFLNFPTTGNVASFSGAGMSLDVLGQILSGNFAFSQVTDSNNNKVFAVSASNVQLSLGSVVSVTGASGTLLLSSSGLAGQLGGTVTLAASTGVSFGGTFNLAINTTPTQVNTNLTDVFNPVQLTGSPTLTFSAGAKTIARMAGSWTTDGFHVGDTILVTGTGTANDNQTFTITAIDSTGATLTVAETVAGGSSGTSPQVQRVHAINIPAGPYVQVTGTGVSLQVAGQTLTGNFSFQQQNAADGTPVVTVAVSSVVLNLGDGTNNFVTITVAQGTFLLTSAGLAGQVTAGFTLGVPAGANLTLSASTIQLDINTGATAVDEQVNVLGANFTINVPAGPYVRLELDNASLVIGPTGSQQTFAGSFVIEQATTAAGKVVSVSFSNVSLSLGGGTPALIAVTNGAGVFLLTSTGIAGVASANITIAASAGISVGGTFQFALNTTGTAVQQNFTVDGSAVALNVPTGSAASPFVQVQALGATLTIAGFNLTADQLDFTQDAGGIIVSGTNLSFVLQAGSTRIIGLQHADFLFQLTSAGIAGAAIHAQLLGPNFGGNVTLSGSVSLTLNTTTTDYTAAGQTFMIDGQSVPVPAAPANGSFVKVELDANADGSPATLGVLNNALTADSFVFQKSGAEVQVSGTNLGFLLQAGSHQIVKITNASFAFDFTSAGVIGAVVNATVAGPDFANISLTGTVSLLVNTTPTARVLTVASQQVTLQAAPVGGAYVQVEFDAATLSVFGSSLTADQIVLQKQGANVSLTGTNLGLDLEAGPTGTTTRILAISGGSFAFQFTAAGLIGAATASTFQGPNFSSNITLTAAGVALLVNTTTTAQTFTIGGQSVAVPAAAVNSSFVELQVASASLTVFGSVLSADSFVFQKNGNNVLVAGQNLSFTLSAGGTRIIELQNAAFAFVFTKDGLAGAVTNATVTGPDLGTTVSFTGTVSLLVNTTTVAQTLLVGGQSIAVPAAAASSFFVQIQIANAVLSVLGNSLTADSLTFQKNGSNVAVSGTNLGFLLQAGSKRVFQLQGASFAFLFTSAGIAGAAIDATLLGPDFGGDFSLSGTVALSVNTTGAPQSVTIVDAQNPAGKMISLPGSAGSTFLRIAITGTLANPATLSVLGASITADEIDFQSTTTNGLPTVQVDLTNLNLGLGDGSKEIVSVMVATASLTISNQGITGSFTASVAIENLPDVSFTASNLQVTIDTTAPAAQFVQVSGTGLTLTVAGQTITGDFIFQQLSGSNGQRVVRVAISNLSLSLGGSVVSVTDGQGFLLANSNGLAGSFSVSASFTLPGGLSLTVNTIRIDINTGNVAVAESLTLAGDVYSLQLPAGPFLQVTVVGAQLTVTSAVVLSGDFSFSQAAGVTSLGLANLSLTYQGNGITNGVGAFVFVPAGAGNTGGIAGTLSGNVSVAASGFSVGGNFGLRINTTNMAVTQSVQVNGQTVRSPSAPPRSPPAARRSSACSAPAPSTSATSSPSRGTSASPITV